MGTPANGGGEIDAGLLGENMMLAAQSLGLGTYCLGGPVRFIKTDLEAKIFLDRLEMLGKALDISVAWKLKYRCKARGYERLRVGAIAGMAEVYDGRGLFRQQITPMYCPECKTIQNIIVGGIIADVAPSYRSEVGRLI